MRETGSEGTKLANYGSDLDSYSPEHHIYVTILNEHDQDAHNQHDPNETPDQISEDDLTTNTPQDEDEARRIARRRKNERRAQCRVPTAERAHVNPRDLNQDFDNVVDLIFDTPIAAMAEATIRLMQMPRNVETDRKIQLTRNVVTQLKRQNPLFSIRGSFQGCNFRNSSG